VNRSRSVCRLEKSMFCAGTVDKRAKRCAHSKSQNVNPKEMIEGEMLTTWASIQVPPVGFPVRGACQRGQNRGNHHPIFSQVSGRKVELCAQSCSYLVLFPDLPGTTQGSSTRFRFSQEDVPQTLLPPPTTKVVSRVAAPDRSTICALFTAPFLPFLPFLLNTLLQQTLYTAGGPDSLSRVAAISTKNQTATREFPVKSISAPEPSQLMPLFPHFAAFSR
jgi:hypothetical protein